MTRVKRSSFVFFSVGEKPFVDAGAFLRGELQVRTESHLQALALLTGETQEISLGQLGFICRLSARTWSSTSQFAGEPALEDSPLEDLAERGWILCDSDRPDLARLRQREDLLSSCGWHPNAALYHFMDREDGATPLDVAALKEIDPENAREFVRRHGSPPDPFYKAPNAGPALELPLIEGKGPFFESLENRRTTRGFDTSRSLAFSDLAILLRYTFGCHGTFNLSSETLLVHKSSPSGGSLHPIEAYPLILDVEGVPTGLYHYDIRDHALEPLQTLDRTKASELAVELANGQAYARSAHVLILMTARFLRNHWKYWRRSRTYGVMLMDAGHLGQTFYLVAAELGLGAFFTAAIHSAGIEQLIGTEPQEEGALAICGCGVQRSDGEDLGLAFEPFVPRSDRT